MESLRLLWKRGRGGRGRGWEKRDGTDSGTLFRECPPVAFREGLRPPFPFLSASRLFFPFSTTKRGSTTLEESVRLRRAVEERQRSCGCEPCRPGERHGSAEIDTKCRWDNELPGFLSFLPRLVRIYVITFKRPARGMSTYPASFGEAPRDREPLTSTPLERRKASSFFVGSVC